MARHLLYTDGDTRDRGEKRKAFDSPECIRARTQFSVNHPDAPLFTFDFGKPGPSLQILIQPAVKPRSKLSKWMRKLRTWWIVTVVGTLISALVKCPYIARWYYGPELRLYRKKIRPTQ
jgi:hypothetical protein